MTSTYRPRMTERQLQDAIVECARALGYTHVYHTFLSINSESGFLDLVLLRPPRIVIVECKTEVGIVSPAQEDWLEAWAMCGATTAVIRPSDWLAGKVEEMLR